MPFPPGWSIAGLLTCPFVPLEGMDLMGSPAPHPGPSLTRSLREHGIQCHEHVWVLGHMTLDKFLNILSPVSHLTSEGDNGSHPTGFCEHEMTKQVRVGTRDCCCVVTRCLTQGALLGVCLWCAEVLWRESGLSEGTDSERGLTGHRVSFCLFQDPREGLGCAARLLPRVGASHQHKDLFPPLPS